MFDSKASLSEQAKQEEYLKTKIQEAFNLFVKDKKGYVDKIEIPYIMRYLGQFPSEQEVIDQVIPEIEDDEPSQFIKLSKFEPYMIDILKKKTYEPKDSETLMAAFQLLDPEKKGYIDIESLETDLKNPLIDYKDIEIKSFKDFATNKDPEAKRIYYEDYIQKLQQFINKHLENVMKGYPAFAAKKQQQ